MPESAIIAVLGTLAGALITGVLSLYNMRLQQDQINNRVEAETYVKAKMENFIELDETLVEVDRLLVEFVFESRCEDYELEMSEERYDRLSDRMAEMSDLVSKCGLFLEWEKREELAYSCIPLRIVFDSIRSGDDRKIDWGQVKSKSQDENTEWEIDAFRKHIRDARSIIKAEINEPIRQLREPTGEGFVSRLRDSFRYNQK